MTTTTAQRPTTSKIRGLLNRKGLNYDSRTGAGQIALRKVADGVEVRAHGETPEQVAAVLTSAGYDFRARHMVDDPWSADKDYWIFTVSA